MKERQTSERKTQRLDKKTDRERDIVEQDGAERQRNKHGKSSFERYRTGNS